MAHGSESALTDGVFLLGFALVFVLLFRRIGLGQTLGFLVAGMVVGPHMLGLVGDAQAKLHIAELGITLLLFVVGLELSPARLWRLKEDIFGLGGLQVVCCGLVLAAIIAAATQSTWAAALALGLPLALSSTAQVLPMLQSAGRLHSPFGERAFAILLFQDLSIVPLITVIAALSRNPAAAAGPPGWLLGLYTVGAIVGLVAMGRFVLRPLFRFIGLLGEREMFIFAALFTVIVSAAVMESLGLSTALGAFVAGVMLADSPYRHELEADVEPFRAILLGLFFLAVGMMLDLPTVMARPGFVVGMALALIAAKTAIIMLIGLAFRMNWRAAFALGLLLNQGGEFGFVLFAQAQNALLIAPEAASLFGAIVTLSMATTPFLMSVTRRYRAAPDHAGAEPAGPTADGATAIVVGYGRFGQTVAQMLIAQGIQVSLIDTDVEMIETAGTFGARVHFGDGTRMELLRRAGAAEAQLIMFCQDGDTMDGAFLTEVAKAFPEPAVFVRAYDRRSLIRMRAGPMAGYVREVRESAITLARMAMEHIDVDQADIDRAEQEFRRADKERLALQRETGDLRAGIERIITAGRSPRTNGEVS